MPLPHPPFLRVTGLFLSLPSAFIDPRCGGQAFLDQNGYLAKGPDLAAEIAASTASLDLGLKFNAYRRNAVREYIIWRVLERELDWFLLRRRKYEPLTKHKGIWRSEALAGLWLDGDALVNGDLIQVHEILRQGLASPEHQAFVERLRKARLGVRARERGE